MVRERVLRQRVVQAGLTWALFFIGLFIMTFGIALMIRANLGVAPWDVLHIGLFRHFGLTVGTWSILIGMVIVGSTAFLTKKWPPLGAVLNMLLCGVFLDFFLGHLHTPVHLIARFAMLLIGIVVNGIGISLYISAHKGAGPRDSLMLFLVEKTGLKLTHVRRIMEIGVLAIGWILGGPVSIGTILFGLTVGSIVGTCLPISEKFIEHWIERREKNENINKGAIRPDDYDGSREELREGSNGVEAHRQRA